MIRTLLSAIACCIISATTASAQLIPLIDGPGLYESGNSIPLDHLAAGWVALAAAQPVNGTAALLCTGMSNARQEFGVSGQASALVFANKIEAIAAPSFRAPGGCQDAMTSPVWAQAGHPIYGIADSIISGVGVQPEQVRAAFHKLVYPNPENDFASVEDYTQGLAEIGADVVRAIRANYPNVEIVWLQSRSYGGFAVGTLNPEPYAHASGIAAKRLIQAQIDQRRTGVVDPRYGDLLTDAPWIGWGPYFWASETPRSEGLFYVRSDFMADGVHPTNAGVDKISDEMVSWCVDDPMCAPLALPEPRAGVGAGVLLLAALVSARAGRIGSGATSPRA